MSLPDHLDPETWRGKVNEDLLWALGVERKALERYRELGAGDDGIMGAMYLEQAELVRVAEMVAAERGLIEIEPGF